MTDIEVLISGFFDDTLSGEQFDELVAWINESEVNARAFAIASTDHSNLRELCHGDLVYELHDLASADGLELIEKRQEGSSPDLLGEVSKASKVCSQRPFSLSFLRPRIRVGLSVALQWGTVAAAVIAGVFGTLQYQKHFSANGAPLLGGGVDAGAGLQAPPLLPVARLVGFGGDLQTDLVVPRSGSELQAGQVVTISNGYGDVSFASGAELQLEGPLALTITDPSSCILKYGRLIADSGSLEDFHISTTVAPVFARPASVVGVATFGEVMNVLVLKGSVDIKIPGSGGEVITLQEDDSHRLFITSNGTVSHVTADLTRDDFPAQKAMIAERLAIPQRYVEAVRLSAPLAYWRFDRVLGDTIPSENRGGPDLNVFGNLRFREAADNVSVDFGLHADTGFLAVQSPIFPVGAEDYTIELWANPTHCHSGVLVSIADTHSGFVVPERHGVLLEFEGPGYAQWAVGLRRRLRFLHRAELSTNPKDGTNLHPNTEYVPGHWHHICAMREGHQLRLYVDGEMVASGEDEGCLPPGLTVKIGQLYLSAPARQFAGQIDEVAIYDRALSDREVLHHFRLADWE